MACEVTPQDLSNRASSNASMTSLIAIPIAISFLTALFLVPCVRVVAHQVGMVDNPDAERKLHHKSVALGGGIAVFAAIFVTFVATVIYDRYFGSFLLGYLTTEWYGLFFAAGAMLLVGLIDDLWSMRGRQKLLLQILIISAVIGTGTLIEKIGLFGTDIYLGAFGYPITMLWLLVAVNALNLIDGADGMATTAGCIISLGLGILSLNNGPSLSAVVAFALAGGLLAFLIFNRPPASIFLGDAGSMMIGLFVGVLAMWSNVKESTVLASAPVAILAIPLFDSSAAVVRRWLTGRSIYATDRGHLHHLLQEKFGSTGMLLVVAGLCTFTTLLSVLSTRYDLPLLAGLGVFGVVTALVCTRSFGHAECRLVVRKITQHRSVFPGRPSQLRPTKTANPCSLTRLRELGHRLGATGGICQDSRIGEGEDRPESQLVARRLPRHLDQRAFAG